MLQPSIMMENLVEGKTLDEKEEQATGITSVTQGC